MYIADRKERVNSIRKLFTPNKSQPTMNEETNNNDFELWEADFNSARIATRIRDGRIKCLLINESQYEISGEGLSAPMIVDKEKLDKDFKVEMDIFNQPNT